MKRVRSILLSFRFPPDFAGGGLQASRLMEKLGDLGVEVTALTKMPECGVAARDERDFGGRVVRFGTIGSLWLRDILLSLRAAWWLFAHPDWDLLHVSGFSYFAVLPVWLAKLRAVAVTARCRRPGPCV